MAGKGVGKALFNEVVAVAQRRDAHRLEWQVLDWNAPAIGFYERLGASVDGMVERPVDPDSTGHLDCDPSNVGRRMKISAHKFGGASVSDAQAIQRVGQLLSDQIEAEERAVVVVSAMGKTTNALEAVWSASGEERTAGFVGDVRVVHMAVAEALGLSSSLTETLRDRMALLAQASRQPNAPNPWMPSYDAMVAAGELASTTLVAAWLSQAGMSAAWWDVRDTLHTSGPHRFARVDESTLGEAGTSLRARMDDKATWWSPKASSDDTPTARPPPWAAKVPITALPCWRWPWVPGS